MNTFEGGLITLLGLITGVCCGDFTIVSQTAVAKISTNINIPCALGREEQAPFWYINDTAYELFSIPLDFLYIPVVNSYTQLTIPVVVQELSGTLFQCAIFEPSRLVRDRIINQLIVLPSPNANENDTVEIPEGNSLLLNYNNLDIEADATTINWVFDVETVCNRIFVLQGFLLPDVERGVSTLEAPTFSQMFQNTSTGVIPSDQLTNSQGDPIVYRLLAVDENGDVCSMTITQVRFFRFDVSAPRQTRVLAPNSTTCYDIPVTQFCNAPLFVWPRSHQFESGLSCACQVHNSSGAREAFNSCSCLPLSDVRPFLPPNGTVCLRDRNAILNGTVVSFRCIEDRCVGEQECFVHTIISLHRIVIPGPPSPPTITFDPSNGTLCFSAYSHPEFPLQSYDVQVTDDTSVTSSLSATYSTNGTLCLMVTFDPSPSICFPFRVSVTASSDTGTSPLSEMTFESNSEETNDSCSCYQQREQTSVNISNVTATSVALSLTCGLDQTDSIDYTLQGNVQDQIVMLFCGQESQPVTGLLPNTSYVLYRRYSNTQLCRVREFTTEPGSISPTSTTIR